jgi:hypothetical protein
MNLSPSFTLEKMTFSNTAKAAGIDNTPGAAEVESLRALCTAVLEPLQAAIGSEIKVNSGYRSAALNKRVGGEANSQHLTGQAADVVAPPMQVVETFKKAIELKLPYDQIIYEVKPNSKWVHVSHKPGANKGEILVARPNAAGKMTYTSITAEQALAMSEPVSRSRSAAAELFFEECADEPEGEAAGARVTAKKTPVKKPAAKKAVAKKAAAKRPAVKKPASKRPVAKVAAKKATAKKPAAKKAPVKRVVAKKAR